MTNATAKLLVALVACLACACSSEEDDYPGPDGAVAASTGGIMGDGGGTSTGDAGGSSGSSDAPADARLTPEDPCGDLEGRGPIYPVHNDAGSEEGGIQAPDFTLPRNASACLNAAQAQLCGWEHADEFSMCSDVTYEEVEACAAALLVQDSEEYCAEGYRAPLQDESCLSLFIRDGCHLDPLGRPMTCDFPACPPAPAPWTFVAKHCCAGDQCGFLLGAPPFALDCVPADEIDWSQY